MMQNSMSFGIKTTEFSENNLQNQTPSIYTQTNFQKPYCHYDQ